jgi:hypothetical protein
MEREKPLTSLTRLTSADLDAAPALKMKREDFRKLRRRPPARPPAPAKNRGRVQLAIRRAFVASGAEILPSDVIYDWAYVRRRLGRCKTLPAGVYSRALRTLRTMCEPVGRGGGSARPILWRLRNSDSRK